MLEATLRRVLRAVFGSGANISAANPVPVTTEVGVTEKGVIHDTAYVTPNDFFVTVLTPTNAPSIFTLAGSFSVAGVLSVTITRALNTQTVEFNAGVALAVDSLYQFDVLVLDGDTINFQYSIDCDIQVFRVLER